jgi:hypothetical protein
MSAFSSGTNTSPFSSNTGGAFGSSSSTQLGQLDNILRSSLNNILELLAAYADGDYSTVAEDLTLDRYNALSTLLHASRKTGNTDYEIIRNSAVRSLKGLQRAYLQYTELTNTSDLYNVTKDRADILDDMTRLQEYIDGLNTKAPTSIFGEHHIQSAVAATIPPVYLTYINLYGFPPDGVFDPAKLAIAAINTN